MPDPGGYKDDGVGGGGGGLGLAGPSIGSVGSSMGFFFIIFPDLFTEAGKQTPPLMLD
jgi:hypothetical protein